MKRLLALFSALVLLLLLLVLALPFTAPGTRVLLSLLPRLAPVTVEYSSGSLLGNLRLRRVVVPLDGLRIEIDELATALRPACLWNSEFCFRELAVGRIAIDVSDTQAADDDAATPPKHINIPFGISAEQATVDALVVRWPGGSWEQGAASLRLQLGGELIAIAAAEVADAVLTLTDDDNAPATQRTVLPSIALPLELAVDNVRLLRPRWNFYGSQHQHSELFLRGRLQGEYLELPELHLATEGWGEFSLAGNISFREDWPLQADAEVVIEQPPGAELLAQRRATLAVSGNLAALVLELQSPGSQQLQLRATVDVLDRELSFQGRASLAWDQPWLLNPLAQLPPGVPPLELVSPLEIFASGGLTAQSVDAQVELRGAGYQPLRLATSARYQDQLLIVDSLELVERGGESALYGNGQLQWAATTRWSAQLNSPGLVLPPITDYMVGHIQGQAQLYGSIGDGAWDLSLQQLELSGRVNKLPAQATGSITTDSERYIRDANLQLDVNGAQLTLKSATTQEGAAQEGAAQEGAAQEGAAQEGAATKGTAANSGAHLELRVADLGRWQPGASGELALLGQLSPTEDHLDVSGVLRQISWEGLSVDRADLSAALTLRGSGGLNGKLTGSKLDLDGFKLETLIIELEGDRASHRASINSVGDIQAVLHVAGSWDGQAWAGELMPVRLATPLGDWGLADTVRMAWNGEQGSISDHCWRHVNASLCTTRLELGASGQAQLQLQGELGFIESLFPQAIEIDGSLDLDINASWGGVSGLQLGGSGRIGPGSVSQFFPGGESARVDWESIELDLRQLKRGLDVRAGMRRAGHKIIDFAAVLPKQREDPLTGELVFDNLQLAAIKPFIPSLSLLEGRLDGRVELAGTVDQPLGQGNISWRDGRLQVVGNPTEVTAAELALDLRGDVVALRGSAQVGAGPLALSGEATLRPELNLQLKLKGVSNKLLFPPSGEVVVSSDLEISGTPTLLGLKGSVQLEEGQLQQDQLPEGSVDVSSDVVEVDLAGNVLREERPFDTRIKVRVKIAPRFRVKGSGLDAKVGGDLNLRQEPGRPLQLFGNLDVIGGEFNAYGQRLQIKQGKISFVGLPENPELDLRAERDIPLEQVTAGVVVQGTLSEPLLTVYSDPAMSQTEALSYLIRGRGLDSGAGADGTALALSIGTGLVNRSKVVAGLNKLPGVSGIEFGAEGSDADTAATVSGYIGERIYLSYGVGLYEPVNVLTARLYLQARLWLEVVSRLESSVDIYYSFDID